MIAVPGTFQPPWLMPMPASMLGTELPAKVVCVLQPGIRAKSASGRELVRRVAEEVYTAEGEALCYLRGHGPCADGPHLKGHRGRAREDKRSCGQLHLAPCRGAAGRQPAGRR